jgi:YhcH/YjgK/YiaL family protein
MIFDTIANAPKYFPLHPHFAAAFDWLANNPDAHEGKYEIVGAECFVMIQHPTGRGKDDPLLEAHNEYIDIQITLEGVDEIGWKARKDCSRVKQEYSSEDDAALWPEAPDFYVRLAPGTFVVLYPEDAHGPLAGDGSMKKAVFKLRVR